MILTCNSCSKKFVVPDSAITTSGRTVQCGSCGNKWKQFPVNEIKKTEPIRNTKKTNSKPKQVQPKIQKVKKVKSQSEMQFLFFFLYMPVKQCKREFENYFQTFPHLPSLKTLAGHFFLYF